MALADAPAPAVRDPGAAFAAELAASIDGLGLEAKYSPSQPRDRHGRFAGGGRGGSVAADEPPLARGMIRLYRGEPWPPRARSTNPIDIAYFQRTGALEAAGRWFVASRGLAEWYRARYDQLGADFPTGITYVDVPARRVEHYRVRNIPAAAPDARVRPREFSRAPDEEFFVPAEVAGARRLLHHRQGEGASKQLDTKKAPPGAIFDPETHSYRGPAGPIPDAAVRAQLDAAIRDSADRLALLTQRHLQGTLGGLEWRAAVQHELAIGHRLAVVLAHGGVESMGPADWAAAAACAQDQYRYFTQWAAQRGMPGYDRSSFQELARARLYAGQYHTTYERVIRRDAEARGDRQERNVIEPTAEHCDQCVALTARGWVPAGTLPLPGTRTCRTGCRCHLETRPIALEAPPPLTQTAVPHPAGRSGAEIRDALLKDAEREATAIARLQDRVDATTDLAELLTREIGARIDQMDPLERFSPEWERLNAQVLDLQNQRAEAFAASERLAAQVQRRRARQVERLRKRHLYQAPNTAAQIDLAPPSEAAAATWRAGIAAWRRLVGPEMDLGDAPVLLRPIPATEEQRAYYSEGNRSVYLESQGPPSSFHGPAATVVHELTHWLEYRDDYVNRQVIDFYAQRTQGERLQWLRRVTGNEGFRPDEMTRVDQWLDAYMGKDYGPERPRSHEVLTMALQYLYADPVTFAQKDPAMFAWTLDLLRRRLP